MTCKPENRHLNWKRPEQSYRSKEDAERIRALESRHELLSPQFANTSGCYIGIIGIVDGVLI